MRYYIIAGEASGDLHAGNLMKGLYEEDKAAEIRFRGGDVMEAAWKEYEAPRSGGEEGGSLPGGRAFDYRSGAVMGFFELVGKLGSLLRHMKDCKKDILKFHPDVLILVDYPGFNLRMAGWAHRKDIKVFWYIAPKVWASREWRLKQLKKNVDRLFIVFPFEKEYFASKGMDFVYCGNPLVDAVDNSPAMTTPREQLRASLPGCEGNDSLMVALLAGSRLNEVKTMMPLFKEVISILKADGRFDACRYVVAGAPGRKREDYGELVEGMDIVFGKTQEIVRAADAAVINSGTASLEAVLLGTPHTVAYKITSRLSYLLGKYFIFKAKYISLGNLCLDRLVFKEFYLNEGRRKRNGDIVGGEADCTAQNVAAELERLLTDAGYRKEMQDGYKQIRASLGEPGSSRRVASAMTNYLRKFLRCSPNIEIRRHPEERSDEGHSPTGAAAKQRG